MGVLDLILPYPPVDGKVQVLEFATGNTVWRDAKNPFAGHGVMTWDDLAGYGLPNPCVPYHTVQPYVGCPTGGGVIADMLMRKLAER